MIEIQEEPGSYLSYKELEYGILYRVMSGEFCVGGLVMKNIIDGARCVIIRPPGKLTGDLAWEYLTIGDEALKLRYQKFDGTVLLRNK